MIEHAPFLLTLGGILVSAGAAWGGARAGHIGMQRIVEEIKTELREIKSTIREHTQADDVHQRMVVDRLARLETKWERSGP